MPFKPWESDLRVNKFTINDEECEQIEFHNRVEDGFYRSYYSNGQLFSEIEYKGCHVVRGFKYYYSNGQIKCFVPTRGHMRHGVHREWDKIGKVVREDVYLHGRFVGTLEHIIDSRGPFWILLNFEKEER